ncbi:hypothetical protein [Bernardetia sp.]|uniref:hypothetical protein n=1 Tax=Bernardetia sp. TaxID=1937974 RepID=UPI0025B9B388|nr:hypothetical protein [Bernardetia sp.]
MNKSLEAHKQELQNLQAAHTNELKEQLGDTKNVTVNVAKLALIGGASAYVGIKLTGFVLGKVFGKKKNNEPQVIYLQAPESTSSNKSYKKEKAKKSFWKGIAASAWATLLPLATAYAKKEGSKVAEKQLQKLLEKYKNQIPMEKLEKLGLDKFFKS